MFTTKNSKSYNSLRNWSIVAVKECSETIGWFVQFGRISHNRFGGTNHWDCVQFIPKEGVNYEAISLDEESNTLRDLRLYNEDPKVFIHLGARYGEEERVGIYDYEKFSWINFRLTPCQGGEDYAELKEIVGKIDLWWDGEETPIGNTELYASDEEIIILDKRCGTSISVRIHSVEGVNYRYLHEGEDFVEVYRTPKEEEVEQAPAEEDVNDEPRAMRRRRPRLPTE